MPSYSFSEFEATREQFELTKQAEWTHALDADAPEQHIRFATAPEPPTNWRSEAPAVNVSNYVETWRELFTIPDLNGLDPISFLFVRTNETTWAYGLGLFFRITVNL